MSRARAQLPNCQHEVSEDDRWRRGITFITHGAKRLMVYFAGLWSGNPVLKAFAKPSQHAPCLNGHPSAAARQQGLLRYTTHHDV